MFPDASQNQPGAPASLPMVPLQPQSAAPAPAPAPTPAQPAPAGSGMPLAQVALQAQQLVTQYRNDPFRLSIALEQLKRGYLAEQYHISPNLAEK